MAHKACKYWVQGRGCKRGDSCPDLHETVFEKRNVCHRFQRGECRYHLNGGRCWRIHMSVEKEYAVMVKKCETIGCHPTFCCCSKTTKRKKASASGDNPQKYRRTEGPKSSHTSSNIGLNPPRGPTIRPGQKTMADRFHGRIMISGGLSGKSWHQHQATKHRTLEVQKLMDSIDPLRRVQSQVDLRYAMHDPAYNPMYRDDCWHNEDLYRHFCKRDDFLPTVAMIVEEASDKKVTLVYCKAGRHRSLSCVRYIVEEVSMSDCVQYHLAICTDAEFRKLKQALIDALHQALHERQQRLQ